MNYRQTVRFRRLRLVVDVCFCPPRSDAKLASLTLQELTVMQFFLQTIDVEQAQRFCRPKRPYTVAFAWFPAYILNGSSMHLDCKNQYTNFETVYSGCKNLISRICNWPLCFRLVGMQFMHVFEHTVYSDSETVYSELETVYSDPEGHFQTQNSHRTAYSDAPPGNQSIFRWGIFIQ